MKSLQNLAKIRGIVRKVVGNCKIVGEVASGGMAIVYRAEQDDLQRTVAIKALKPAVAKNDQLKLRFEREAISLAQLQHENIIHVYDYYRQEDNSYIVMEFVDGQDLYYVLEDCEVIPPDVAAIIALQVARALDYIHFRNIIHRDIKPANIMLSKNGNVKVMDFGIARDRYFDEDLTQAGMGIGTPAYMSPEQIQGDKLSAISDIFSIGIVLYQMTTGLKPFAEDDMNTVMQKIQKEPHVKPRKVNPSIPKALERIIDKCLQKDPKARYRSAQNLALELERFLAKQVEMNFSARLVLFHKNHDLITEEEANEYISPAFIRGSTELSEASFPIATQLKRNLSIHGLILAITAIVVGVIHLAPVGASVPQANVAMGHLKFVVNPWGQIYADDKLLGVTPLASPLALPAGRHQIKVTHPFCQDGTRPVELEEGSIENAEVIRFDLSCKN